jgi:hypothetical protein
MWIVNNAWMTSNNSGSFVVTNITRADLDGAAWIRLRGDTIRLVKKDDINNKGTNES